MAFDVGDDAEDVVVVISSACADSFGLQTLRELDFLLIAIEPATLDPTMLNTSRVAARRLSQIVVFRSPKSPLLVLGDLAGKDDMLGN